MTMSPAETITLRLDRLQATPRLWSWIGRLAFGGFFEIYDLSLTAVIAPALVRAGVFHEGPAGLFGFPDQATFSFTTLFGIFIGAAFLGGIVDRIGRKRSFAGAMIWYAAATVAMATQHTAAGVCASRLVAGVGLGVQMITIDCYLTELVPRHLRGRGFSVAQFLQLLGIPAAHLLGFALAEREPLGIAGWRWIALFPAIGTLAVLALRRGLPESPRWLAEHGRLGEAERIVAELEADAPPTLVWPAASPKAATVAHHDDPEPTLWQSPLRGRVLLLLVGNAASSIGFYGFSNWLARDALGIPLIVGSCGTSGRDIGVDWMVAMLREIASEDKLSLRLATIKSDQPFDYLKARLAEGRIHPLSPAPPISETILASSHVVGMMGAEPIAAAIAGGADVVLAGRASDSALFAAVPLAGGAHPGLTWHAAKTLECGAACAVVPAADGMFATLRGDYFDIEPLDIDARCTPRTIAAHTLDENANPFQLIEPSGTVDTEQARYVALDDRSVRVSGSRLFPADEYTIKLEGAQLAGYQTVVIGGIRDPHIIQALADLIPKAKAYFAGRIADLYGTLSPGDVDISYRLYGLDAVMGPLEPLRGSSSPHEIGVLITVTAPSQDMATKIATMVAHVSAHLPVPGYEGIVSTLAYPFSPPEIARGPAYRFTLNHVVVPDDPHQMFRAETSIVREGSFEAIQ